MYGKLPATLALFAVLGPVHPRTIKPFLPSFLSRRHSREKRYQALSRFTVLIATESWAGPGNEASITAFEAPCLQTKGRAVYWINIVSIHLCVYSQWYVERSIAHLIRLYCLSLSHVSLSSACLKEPFLTIYIQLFLLKCNCRHFKTI